MPDIPDELLKNLFTKMDESSSSYDTGKALEDFISDFFSCVPGIIITERNSLNVFRTEEVDIALWNDKDENGFRFLPNNLLVECKNWSSPVGSQEISYFGDVLRRRGLDHGFFIAMNGITGDNVLLTDAHHIVSEFLLDKIKIIVLNIEDIKSVKNTDELIYLIKTKITKLHATGTTL